MTPLVISPMHDDQSDGWKHIDGGGFYAQAKIYLTPSKHGLLGGRISKLTIWRSEDDPTSPNEIFNYDRGFDFGYWLIDGWPLALFIRQLVEQVDGPRRGWWLGFLWGYVVGRVKAVFRFSWQARRD
ncbi:MAG TPA: hypothetical protein VI793_19785 [Anaerolineales bacterium]|nr:hypothetical protein [Anaerolineales bacterium]